MSWLAFASNTTNDLSGKLIWLKQAGSKSKYYLGGFTCECDAFGSTYRPHRPRPEPAHRQPDLLRWRSRLGTSPIRSRLARATRSCTPGKQLKLSFSASTGTFKGTFLDPATGKPLPFSGAVFQKLNVAYGTLFGTE